ncbi:MAG: response regulator [Spirochaetales bacterium]|jgi:signal transduction histidine kinase/CheY-like chemotaxis protein|nr:response regulator [Spirochaetales bacterium]
MQKSTYEDNSPESRAAFLEAEIRRIQAENYSIKRKYMTAQVTIERIKSYNTSRDKVFDIIIAEKSRQEKYFRLLLENVQDKILLLDRQMRFVYCSEVFLRRAGIANFGVINEMKFDEVFAQYIKDESSGNLLAALKEAVTGKEVGVVESILDIGHTDASRYYTIFITPMINEEDECEGAIVLFHDMTDILRSKEQAELASKAKSTFLAQTSHEIRTPMNAVIGMSELALRADTLPKALEYVEGIKQAGLNLLSIINDILDISKIEAGTLEVKPAPYMLASLLHDVINVIRIRVAEKPIIFIATVDASIPNNLVGDVTRMRQILLNLLSNAVKYTARGHIRFTVKKQSSSAENSEIILLFEIADTGVGIRQKDMAGLFTSFTRLDMKKNHGVEGTGLGLAISRSLCRAMGGDITLSSEYGAGSVFTAAIPQGFRNQEPLAEVENPEEKSVLLFDEKPLYASSVLSTLQNLCVPAELASGQEDFFRLLEEGRFAFAFTTAASMGKAREILKAKKIATQLILLANSGEIASVQNTSLIVMPAYAVSVANILNNRLAVEHRKRQGGKFIAPDAKILVVDDISTNLVVTAGLLAIYRSQVDTCTNGEDAITFIQQKQYDLVFMDHMMPGMDGIECTRHIRELEGAEYSKLPIVALTANAITGMREMFLECGFNDYLTKPIEIGKLNEIMETWLPQEKRLVQEVEETEETSSFLAGVKLEGLDIAAGRERYGEETYIDVLRSYSVHTPPHLEKLTASNLKAPTEAELKGYTITVHGIKGATYGICASGLAKQAEELERAARIGDITALRERTAPFIKRIRCLIEKIGGVLEHISLNSETKPRQEKPDPALLRRLLEAARRYKANQMEEIITELEKSDYENDSGLVSWLREQMDNLEYGAVCKRLESEI